MDAVLVAEVKPGRVSWDKKSRAFHADMSDIQFMGQPTVVVVNPATGGRREFTSFGPRRSSPDAEDPMYYEYRSKDGIVLKLWND